jgi:hypothetical protein
MRSILVLLSHYAFEVLLCTCQTERPGVPNEQQSQQPQLHCIVAIDLVSDLHGYT